MTRFVTYYFFFILLITLADVGAINAQILPAERSVDWSQAGNKDIFPNTRDTLNILDYGGRSDSTLDNTVALQAAMQALGSGEGVVYFPPGKYLFRGSVNMKAGVTIQGSGTATTFFYFAASSGVSSDAFVTNSYNYPVGFVAALAGYEKGSKKLKLQSTNGFSGAKCVELLEDNGSWDTAPVDWATNTVGQIIPIDSVINDTLLLGHPLRLSYQAGLNPRLRPVLPIKHVAFKCFTIQRADVPTADVSFFTFFNAAQCLVTGVHCIKGKASHIKIDRSANITISGCYFYDAFAFDGAATHGYGITIFTRSGECLVENNIFRRLRHGVSLKQGANGNVVAYNYFREGIRSETPSDFTGDISLHGHYAYANLIEGNIADNIFTDQTYGPSGPNNTFLRNRANVYGMGIFNTGSQITSGQAYIGNDAIGSKNIPPYITYFTHPFSLAGVNHFSYANRERGATVPSATLSLTDSSYYLKIKPAFWTNSNAWPSIGLPLTNNTGSIPAQDRYLAGQFSTCQLYIRNPILLSLVVTSFKVTLVNNAVVVDWVIEGDNLARVDIQRSNNDRDFITIASSTSNKSLIFDKPSKAENLYYKLKVYGKDRNIFYSPIRVVGQKKNAIVSAPYFNKDGLVIDARLEPGTKCYLKLFSVQGQLVQQQTITETKTLVPTTKCNAGLWLVCISDDYGALGTYKVVKL